MARRRTRRVCLLAEALQAHEIDATVFEPFVVAGLGGTPDSATQTTEFTVTLHDIGEAGTRTHRLRLQWHGANAFQGVAPTHSRVMTELAACGIACAVLWHYTGFWVGTAAEPGAGFDYWITNGSEEGGIEISGTLAAEASEMRARHREKQAQLFSALNVGGFVAIVGLARREIILSYHAPQEAEA